MTFGQPMTDLRIIGCEHCGTEGRIYSGHPNDPHPRDCGPCPVCDGECSVVIEVEPIEMEELDRANCPDCGQRLPLLYPCNERTCPNGH